MSRYDEDAKEQIADDIVDWLTSTRRLAERDIDVYLHPGAEAYVTIKIDSNVLDRSPLESEALRNATTESVSHVKVSDYTAHITP